MSLVFLHVRNCTGVSVMNADFAFSLLKSSESATSTSSFGPGSVQAVAHGVAPARPPRREGLDLSRRHLRDEDDRIRAVWGSESPRPSLGAEVQHESGMPYLAWNWKQVPYM